MSQVNPRSYYFKTIIILASISLVLQACGKGKLTVANPNATRTNQEQAKPVDTPTPPAPAVADSTTDALTPAKVVKTQMGKESLTITIKNAAKTVDDQTHALGIKAVISVVGEKSEDLTINAVNPVPADKAASLTMSSGEIKTATIEYTATYTSYIDYQNPQNYYLVVNLTSSKQDKASRKFALVIGEDDSTKAGVLELDQSGTDSLDSKADGFYKFLIDAKTTKPDVLALSKEAFESAESLEFKVGTETITIKATGTLTAIDDTKKVVTANLDLLINGVKTTLTDADHSTDPTLAKNFENTKIPVQTAKAKYNLSVVGNMDAQLPNEYFMIISLQIPDSDLTKAENSQSFAVVFGTGNDQLKKRTIMMLNNPVGSALSTDRMIEFLKTKFPASKVAPTAEPAVPAPAADKMKNPVPKVLPGEPNTTK